MARFPLRRRAGRWLFICVSIFGAATVVFGLSHTLWLSLASLAVAGAADTISVIIRGSLLQLATPPEMRGRVSAVNSLFIGASNELGEFESGLTAQWWGAVRATVIGGLGALAVSGLWAACSRPAQGRRADGREFAPACSGCEGSLVGVVRSLSACGFGGGRCGCAQTECAGRRASASRRSPGCSASRERSGAQGLRWRRSAAADPPCFPAPR